MKNEERIVELLAESLIKQDEIVGELKKTNSRLEKVESEITKLNLHTAENSRSILRLADEFEKVIDLHQRVNRLENAVFK